MRNPYRPPDADLDKLPDPAATFHPTLLAFDGRIGRLRYLAYCFLAVAIALLLCVGAVYLEDMAGARVLIAGPVLWMIALLVIAFVFGRRRLHDMGHSGWWALLQYIPIAGLLVILWLLAAPGNEHVNRFGPVPEKNTRTIIATAWLAGALALSFLLLNLVALPAYRDYLTRKMARASNVPVMQTPAP